MINKNTNWEARINRNGPKITYDVWLFNKHPRGVEVYNGTDNTVTFYDEGTEVGDTPSFQLNDEQLQALAQALGDNKFHPRKEYVEGKLEATEGHLKDMRTLLKLK